jgi:hypothetical protein
LSSMSESPVSVRNRTFRPPSTWLRVNSLESGMPDRHF